MPACTFFGHRECYGLDENTLYKAIEELILQGVDTFYVGHQGQFDSMVYGCLYRLRKVYPHIRISVVLAYLPTEKREYDISDTMYPEIEGHPKFAITRRNRWMIRMSNYCLCYVRRTWGCAYKFAQRAKHCGLTVFNLDETEL